MENVDVIKECFIKIFGTEIDFSENIVRADVANWDSMKHIEFLMELEKNLDFKLKPEDIAKLNSIKAIISRIEGA